MFSQMLKERNLPPMQDRKTMLETLQREEYGWIPARPEALSFSVEKNIVSNFCAGKATLKRVTANCSIGGKTFSFPFHACLPTGQGKHPFFVHINFRPDVPDRYMPTEELVDNGFAVLSFCYHDVTRDNGDFTDGLAGVLYENGNRGPEDPGKIAMWAWAAQRVMDYAETLADRLDLDRAIVCGHSRLGKTALLAAATDPRFAFAYSNDSGCSGAAVTRGKGGERIRDIVRNFPYWFCENYWKYVDREDGMPFDQHWLLACCAPRAVAVGSASEDAWSDPVSEQLCCLAASPAFEKGFVCDRLASVGETFFQGNVGYHLRNGLHYFSREDWLKVIKFINKHRKKLS